MVNNNNITELAILPLFSHTQSVSTCDTLQRSLPAGTSCIDMTDTKVAETSTPVQETASLEESSDQGPTNTSTTEYVESKIVDKAEDASQEAGADDQPNYPHGFKLVTLVIALCLAVFHVALDQTIIPTRHSKDHRSLPKHW
jgi:hypothetical protein